jgi:tRNA(Ile2) C34 agmatinyltransferase TiaS
MDISIHTDGATPICPKCSGAGKPVGTHEHVTYFRCLSCMRIWAEPKGENVV